MKKSLYILLALSLLLSFSCNKKENKKAAPDTTPRVISIVPRTYVSGGAAIISGYWFSEKVEDNIVEIDGQRAIVTAATKDRLNIVLPDHADGNVDVKVTVAGVRSPDVIPFTYAQRADKTVRISSIVPTEGYVGDEVTIYGENFSTNVTGNTVTFGSATATVTTATRSALIVKAPNHALGVVTVSVLVDGKSATTQFSYIQPPVLRIDAISATSGEIGDVVRLTGEGFSTRLSDNLVTMGIATVEVKAATETTLDVVVPDLPGGNYTFNLKVGSLTATSANFTLAKSWRVETVAGSGTAGTAAGTGTNATLNIPQDCAFDASGLLWFTQRSGGRSIRTFNPVNKQVKNVAVKTATDYLWFNYPWGCTFDNSGRLWFVNKGGTDDAPNVGYWTGSAAQRETALDEAVTTTKNPMCIQCGSDGTLYILCRASTSVIYQYKDGAVTGNFQVPGNVEHMIINPAKTHLFLGCGSGKYIFRALKLSDGSLETIAGAGSDPTAETYTDGEAGNPQTATLGLTEGMCFDSAGVLYFTDVTARTFRSLTPADGGDYAHGTVKTLVGTPFVKDYIDGLGKQAALVTPNGVAVYSDGSIYLMEGADCHRIRRIYLK